VTVAVPALRPEDHRSIEAVLDSLDTAALGAEMAERLGADVPELAGLNDPDLRAVLELSCTQNLVRIWELIRESDMSSGPFTPPAGAAEFARELAHRGLQLSVLLRAYRLGHGYAERRLAEATAQLDMPAEARWHLLAFFTQSTFEYIDAVCTQLVEEYEQERARWVRGAAAARAEFVGAIIDRQPVEPAAATERLGYDITRRHLAFIVWAEPSDAAQQTGQLERAAIALAGALGGGATLTIPVGERVVWGWTSGADVCDDTVAVAARMPSGLRAAVGTLAHGPAGMADSHADALAVRRASEYLGQRPGSVHGYRAHSLLALLATEPERAVRFVETELGDLAAGDDVALRLRATLRVYLEEGLSPVRAGRRLSIHLNTVVYRVKQAEAILGHPVEQRRLELEAALRLAARLGALRLAAGAGHRPGLPLSAPRAQR
jgi:DNA-binding PucR family transcriptional regulator